MPRKPAKPCAYPGCPNLTHCKYCEAHSEVSLKEQKEYNKHKRRTAQSYGTSWKKIRTTYIRAHPYCEECLTNKNLTVAAEVHHIMPVADGGTNDENNLMSLCRSCHSKIHYRSGDRSIPVGG